jgi:bacteriorhodopsin
MVSEFTLLSLKFIFMAEINVQTKKQNSSSWLWIIVVLAIVAAVAYFLMRNNDTVENKVENATSYSVSIENHDLLMYS